MATLATQTIVPGGVGPSYAAAAGGGDALTPTVDTFLHVKNGGGSSITVTIPIPATVRGRGLTSLSIVVPNAGERMIGPFPAELFADPANSGLTTINYSGVTTVTVGVFAVGEF